MSESGPGVDTIRIVGIGMGPQHVTPEAAAALRLAGGIPEAYKAGTTPSAAVADFAALRAEVVRCLNRRAAA